MALFTDTAVVTINDLLPFEDSLAQVISSHNINVDTKISLAMGAISDKVMLWLLNVGVSDPQWLNRRSIGLSTVVVTPSLQRWICFESLSRVFAEAYNLQLNTRYQAKWKEYQQEAVSAARSLSTGEIGIIYNALPRPALPLISVQSGSLPAQGIFVQTCWVDVDGNESALSPENATVLTAGADIAVAMAEGALGAPAAAIGWNVYGGGQSNGVTKQNAQVLAVGSTWELPASGFQVGPTPTGGQTPAFYITLSKQIRRG
jgi:hypothetical protein